MVDEQEDLSDIEAENARWDAILATEESQALLEKLASEALAEHRAGKTRPMVFDDEGRVVVPEKGTIDEQLSVQSSDD